MKKIVIGALTAAMALSLVGCGGRGGSAETASPEGTEQQQAQTAGTPSQENEDRFASLVGQPAIEAVPVVDELGYTASYVDDRSGYDYTNDIAAYLASEGTDMRATLEIHRCSVDAKAKTVEIRVNPLGEKAAKDKKKALNDKLDSGDSWNAVEAYGSAQFPYGFKLHWIVGQIAENPEDENTWFLKATCDVTNEYGATQKDLTCEAEVTGTTDSPEVVSFNVY